MKRNRIIRFSGLAAILAASGVLLFVIMDSFYQRRQAERLLDSLRDIRVGTTDYATVLRMTSSSASHRVELKDGGPPVLEFTYYNRALYWLRLAPYTEFRAWMTFKNGVMVEKAAREFVASCGCTAMISETVRGFGYVNDTAPQTALATLFACRECWTGYRKSTLRMTLHMTRCCGRKTGSSVFPV